jgi:hypothetical protein
MEQTQRGGKGKLKKQRKQSVFVLFVASSFVWEVGKLGKSIIYI